MNGIETIVARAFARISTDWAAKGRLSLERRIVYEISWTFAAICKCVRQIEPMPDFMDEGIAKVIGKEPSAWQRAVEHDDSVENAPCHRFGWVVGISKVPLSLVDVNVERIFPSLPKTGLVFVFVLACDTYRYIRRKWKDVKIRKRLERCVFDTLEHASSTTSFPLP